jgi:hypothetical protein
VARGIDRAQQAATVVGADLGLLSPEEAAAKGAMQEYEAGAFPADPDTTAALQRLTGAETFGELGGVIADDPFGALKAGGVTALESLPISAAALAPAAVAALSGAGVPAAVGLLGAGSAAAEYPHRRLEHTQQAIAEAGQDPSDPRAVAGALADPALRAEGIKESVTGAGAVGLTDIATVLATGGLARMTPAGRAASAVRGAVDEKIDPVTAARRVLAAKAAARAAPVTLNQAALGGLGLEMGGGAAGEALAQLATEGEITGPGEVFLEGFAELPGGAGTVAGVLGRTAAQARLPGAEQSPAELAEVLRAGQALEEEQLTEAQLEGEAPIEDVTDEANVAPVSPAQQGAQSLTERTVPVAAPDTPEFKSWFRGSVVVDEQGAPKPVYHRTAADFENLAPGGLDPEVSGPGIWFGEAPTAEKTPAAHNVREGAAGERIIPAYIRLENPAIVEWDRDVNGYVDQHGNLYVDPFLLRPQDRAAMEKEGFDGQILRTPQGETEYIVFNPEQVKSPYNTGEFSEGPDMLASEELPGAPVKTDTPAFKQWFGESAITFKDGAPRPVYHGGYFDEQAGDPFDTSGVGAHFGTKYAALDRIEGKQVDDLVTELEVVQDEATGEWFWDLGGYDSEITFATEAEAREHGERFAIDQAENADIDPDAATIFEGYLRLENPLRMKDLGTWGLQNVLRELPAQAKLTPEQTDAVYEAYNRSDEEAWGLLKSILSEKGYDGIVYANQVEHRGKDSFIAFYPEQIKSVNNQGTFSPTDPNVLASEELPGPEINPRITSAVVQVGDRVYRGQTHGQAFGEASDQETLVVDRGPEGIRGWVSETGEPVNMDLFETSDGRLINRFEAAREFGVASTEAIRESGQTLASEELPGPIDDAPEPEVGPYPAAKPAVGAVARSAARAKARSEKALKQAEEEARSTRETPQREDENTHTVSPTMEQAFHRDLGELTGMRPETVASERTAWQVEKGVELLQKRFGFPAVDTTDIEPLRALRTITEIYSGLSNMAELLGFPDAAMSFRGNLTLRLAGKLSSKGGVLGLFSWRFTKDKGFEPGTVDLGLHQRSNAFAHEWLHALDLYLLALTGRKRGVGISGVSSPEGTLVPGTKPIRELGSKLDKPFRAVVRAVFMTKDADTVMRLIREGNELTIELNRTEGDLAKATKAETIARLKDKIAELKTKQDELNKEVRKALAKAPTNQAEISKMNDNLRGVEYYAMPTEMMARAFESYMARLAEKMGTPTDGFVNDVSMYDMEAVEGWRRVYPDKNDVERVDAAIGDLMRALQDTKFFGSRATSERAQARAPAKPLLEQAIDEAAQENKEVSAIKEATERTAQDIAALVKAPARVLQSARDVDVSHWRDPGKLRELAFAVVGTNFGTMFGGLKTHRRIAQARGKKEQARAILKVAEKLASSPGEHQLGLQPATFFDIATQLEGEWLRGDKGMTEIFAEHGLDATDEKTMAQLKNFMARTYVPIRAELELRMAEVVKLREQAEEETHPGRKAGLNSLAEQLDQHVQEMMSELEEQEQTARDEGWHHEVIDPKLEAAAKDLRKLLNKIYDAMKDSGQAIAYQAEGNYMPRITNDTARTLESSDEFAAQVRRVYEFEKARKLGDAIIKRDTQAYKEASRLNPEEQAEDYANSLVYGSSADFLVDPKGVAPDPSFAKHRVLPPIADMVLHKFYEQNAYTVIHNYVHSASRRAAYAETFGGPNGHDKRLVMMRELERTGVDPGTKAYINDVINKAVGWQGSADGLSEFVDKLYAIGMISLLPRTLFVSLSEILTLGTRTGDISIALKGVANTFADLVRTKDAMNWRHIAEFLGTVSDEIVEAMIESQFGYAGTEVRTQGSRKAQKWRLHGAKLSGLHAWTRAQRRVTTRTFFEFFTSLAYQYVNETGDARKNAIREMDELGIPQEERKALSEFLIDAKVDGFSVEKLKTLTAAQRRILGIATNRFVDQIIQNPNIMYRASMTTNPYGRMIMSLQSFNYTFFRNVPMRAIERFAGGDVGKMEAIMAFVPSFALLMVAQTAAQALRDLWEDWDGDKFERRLARYEENPKLAVSDAASRAGLMGPLDPAYQFFFKPHFNKSLASTLIGAIPGHYTNHVTNIQEGVFDAWNDETPSSKYKERKALQSLYLVAATPAIIMALSKAGATGPLGWVASTKMTSYGFAGDRAEELAPKTRTEKKRERAKKRRDRRR